MQHHLTHPVTLRATSLPRLREAASAEQGLQRSVQRPWCHIDPSRPVLQRAGTFSDQPPGTAFWYENSNGLAEIAVNRGRADRELGLAIGTPVEIVE